MLKVLLLAVLASAQTSLEVQLPPGPAQTLLAQPAPSSLPELPIGIVQDWSAPVWNTAAPWDAWSGAIATPELPAARLHLMRVARALGRSEAAWQHFAALPRDWAEAALGELLAGQAGLVDGPLIFRPLLPPTPVFDRATWPGLPPKYMYSATDVAFGKTLIDLSVEDAPEGVEIHLTWKSGPAMDFQVIIPTPAGRRARLVYLDWDETELDPMGYRIHVGPAGPDEDPEHILWARCEHQERPWPQLGAAPSNVKAFEIFTTKDDPRSQALGQFAGFLAKTLDLSVSLGTESDAPNLSPISIDLSPGPIRMAKWLDLATQAERLAMAKALAQSPSGR